MIKNIIFDFGNVIVKFDPDIIMSPYIKEKEIRDKLSPIVFDRKYWDRLDDGSMTESEVYESIEEKVPDKYKQAVKMVLNNWYYHLPFIDCSVDFLNKAKEKGYNIFLLSNISKKFSDSYNKITTLDELLSKFDGLVFSGREGIVKPDTKIFEILLNRYCLNPEETVFIDDSARNLAGAEKLGIKTYKFSGEIIKDNHVFNK